jgi:hypothetical protein
MDEMLRSLGEFPASLEKLFARVPPAQIQVRPKVWDGIPGEQFSALEMLCHLRDIEIDGYRNRFRRTAAEESPLLPSLDGYAMAAERKYSQSDPHRVLAEFRAAREQTLQQLRALPSGAWQRTANFEGHGPVTLRGLAELLASHDQQHLACLHWLLAKLDFEK